VLIGETGSQFLKLKWGGLRRLQRSEASNLGGMALTADSILPLSAPTSAKALTQHRESVARGGAPEPGILRTKLFIGEGELHFDWGALRCPGVGRKGVPSRTNPAVKPASRSGPDTRLQTTFKFRLSDHRFRMCGRIVMRQKPRQHQCTHGVSRHDLSLGLLVKAVTLRTG
jgi:hypothetical protein